MSEQEEKKRVTFKTVCFMLKAVVKHRPSLFFVYGMMLIAEFINKMMVVVLPKYLIDELMKIIEGAPLKEHLQLAAIYAGVTVVMNFVTNMMSRTAHHLRQVAGVWFDEYFAVELSDHAMKMDFEHTEDPEALDALSKAKDGINWYSGGVVGILNDLYSIVMNVTVLFGVVTIIVLTCPLLLPIQIIALLFITFFNAKNNKLEAEMFQKLSKLNRHCGYYFYQLSDFSYGKDIRMYDSAKMMSDKADRFGRNQTKLWADNEREKRKNSWGMDIINSLRDGLSYFYIGWLALTRVITIGDFSMCIASASSLYWSMHGIVVAVQNVIMHCRYAYQFIEFLDYPEALEKGNRHVQQGEHTITFSHVGFRYPRTEKDILKDINLTITSGEHLSIVGLNGAGKTTLIKLLCRLYDVTEGEILIDGINIREYSEEEYRKLFAVVFQDFQLFAFSLRENIALDGVEDDTLLENALKLSGFFEDAEKLEHGVDAVIYKSFSEDGIELSGGQKQKTAIARALYKDAPIVILDEPTAALDPVAEYDIYRKFDNLVGGKTAIYISHRLSSCKFCDHIAVFAENTIREYGTHDELVKKEDGIYASMFAAQAQYYVS